MIPSAFDVLGPIMVGPSSSHTAGALRIGAMARELVPAPIAEAHFTLYHSFSRTAEGHGTKKALVAGLLGLETDDPDVARSLEIAEARGVKVDFTLEEGDPSIHPNTADVAITCDTGLKIRIRGESIGGGRVRLVAIDDAPIEVMGDLPTLFVCHEDRPGVLGRLCTAVAVSGVNIATIRTSRDAPGETAYTVIESDEAVPPELLDALTEDPEVRFGSVIYVPGAGLEPKKGAIDVDFSSAAELLELCEAHPGSLGHIMRDREIAIVAQDPFANAEATCDERMAKVAEAMGREVADTIEHPHRSLGGFLDGQAKEVWERRQALDALGGPLLGHAIAYAMAAIERSASMGVIVAAPTAGSAGIVPGTLIAASQVLSGQTDHGLEVPLRARSLPRFKSSLWCAAAIGALAQGNASVSGAEAGCQAETGVAAAMAAAGLVQMFYGSPKACLDAASIAIANTLGLVCDPACGLVEYPCQLRNAAGVSHAVTAAHLALSGVTSPVPLDEALNAMQRVGTAMPRSLRETAGGGLATCPSILCRCGA